MFWPPKSIDLVLFVLSKICCGHYTKQGVVNEEKGVRIEMSTTIDRQLLGHLRLPLPPSHPRWAVVLDVPGECAIAFLLCQRPYLFQ